VRNFVAARPPAQAPTHFFCARNAPPITQYDATLKRGVSLESYATIGPDSKNKVSSTNVADYADVDSEGMYEAPLPETFAGFEGGTDAYVAVDGSGPIHDLSTKTDPYIAVDGSGPIYDLSTKTDPYIAVDGAGPIYDLSTDTHVEGDEESDPMYDLAV
jgi:hypothetical protein